MDKDASPNLTEYRKKRDFSITAEPKPVIPKVRAEPQALQFVVQKHGARRLHYDFRLELDGVMKSWAVTKGPSYDPSDRRLAVHTEDHPIEYNKFEGVIPDKQYGAGPVMIWDRGIWEPEGDVHKAFRKGHVVFTLHGERMKGRWHLVLMRGREEKRENWLLIKGDDEYALRGGAAEGYLDRENTSIISSRTLEEIKANMPSKKAPKEIAEKKRASARKPGSKQDLQQFYSGVALATLVEFPPSGGQWLHEIKYDGYRLMAFIRDGAVTLRTRGGKDWTHKFKALASQLAKLNVDSAVLDGEAVVLDEKGSTSFSALQIALSEGRDERIEGWFFDLLFLNGEDFSRRSLTERKDALRKLLSKQAKKMPLVHYSEHFEGEPDLLEKACSIGAEGIVSKLKDSPYRSRRTHDWVKSKCGLEQEFVIGGFMPAKNHPKAVGALLVGYHKGKELLYAGKVGTGFDQKTAKLVYERLKPFETSKSPFQERIGKGERAYIWVRPEAVCEIAFWEWTADGRIRHASFKGLRDDKAPGQVHEEIPEKPPQETKARVQEKVGGKPFTVEGIAITHPEREVFPGMGISKGDVAIYYAKAMPYMLPFARNRFISLLRCTEGLGSECFFQRAPMKGGKGNVYGMTVNHKGNRHNYMYIDAPAGIIELAQMGAMEFHGWQSQVPEINKPDQIIIDLDPAENIPFDAVKLAALDVRNRLKAFGLESFPRLSGGKGVHITVPIFPDYEWDKVKSFTQELARQMERDAPDAYISNMSKKKREGKIFVDYLRNDFSATAIIPFSLRARENAPIAVLISWSELKKIESAAQFHFGNIGKKLNQRTGTLVEDFFSARQKLKI